MELNGQYAVAIGASTGGVGALLTLAAALPPQFPAPVFVTQHIGTNISLLPELLRRQGPNHAMHPLDGDKPLPGTIYVAQPDHHMLVERGRIRLFGGPKESHCRPAIDPMFRSIALAYQSHAIGVVLTGQLDDGTAGLRAIKECGGIAIVQDPDEAEEPSMPQSALDNVEVNFRLRLAEIPVQLLRLLAQAPRPPAAPSQADAVERENEIARQQAEDLARMIEEKHSDA